MIINESADLMAKMDHSPKIVDLAEETSKLMLQRASSNKISKELTKTTSDKNLSSDHRVASKIIFLCFHLSLYNSVYKNNLNKLLIKSNSFRKTWIKTKQT